MTLRTESAGELCTALTGLVALADAVADALRGARAGFGACSSAQLEEAVRAATPQRALRSWVSWAPAKPADSAPAPSSAGSLGALPARSVGGVLDDKKLSPPLRHAIHTAVRSPDAFADPFSHATKKSLVEPDTVTLPYLPNAFSRAARDAAAAAATALGAGTAVFLQEQSDDALRLTERAKSVLAQTLELLEAAEYAAPRCAAWPAAPLSVDLHVPPLLTVRVATLRSACLLLRAVGAGRASQDLDADEAALVDEVLALARRVAASWRPSAAEDVEERCELDSPSGRVWLPAAMLRALQLELHVHVDVSLERDGSHFAGASFEAHSATLACTLLRVLQQAVSGASLSPEDPPSSVGESSAEEEDDSVALGPTVTPLRLLEVEADASIPHESLSGSLSRLSRTLLPFVTGAASLLSRMVDANAACVRRFSALAEAAQQRYERIARAVQHHTLHYPPYPARPVVTLSALDSFTLCSLSEALAPSQNQG
jgi:hypothetical protein